MKKLINLTPHELNIHTSNGEVITLPSEGVARATEISIPVETLNGNIPVVKKSYGQVCNLPDPKEGVIYIVSALTAQAVSGKRNDVFVPGDLIRDETGKPIGCKGLAKI